MRVRVILHLRFGERRHWPFAADCTGLKSDYNEVIIWFFFSIKDRLLCSSCDYMTTILVLNVAYVTRPRVCLAMSVRAIR